MQVVSEGPVRITRATIEAAWRRRKPELRLIVRDQDARGLALIVNPTSMTWTYAYRPRGVDPGTGRRWPNRTMTIGNPASHSPEDARAEANRIKGVATAGGDPAREKRARVAEEGRQRAATATRLIEDYSKVVPKRSKLRGAGIISPGHAKEEVSHLRAAVSVMAVGDKQITAIDASDLRRLLRADPESPNAARHRFGALSRFFDWCQDEGLLPSNPCAAVAKARRPKPPASRAHYLTPLEMAALWEATETAVGLTDTHRDLIRFLIAVPCRRGEASSMEWQHLDLKLATWSQPGHMTKNRDAHRLHLHPLAANLLQARFEGAGKPPRGVVFPAPRSGKAVDTFTKIKAALADATPELGDWRFHDFRRSFATALGEAGIPETVADAILNHRQSATRGGVLGVYQRASRWPEQVKAMEHWGRLLEAALDGSKAEAKVVPLTARSG